MVKDLRILEPILHQFFSSSLEIALELKAPFSAIKVALLEE